MKKLIFEGHSDDTFGEYGVTNIDHDNCSNGNPVTFLVKAWNGAAYITGQYSRYGNGCWGIDVSPVEEAVLPNWPMQMHFSGYSTVLEVWVPDEFELSYVENQRGC